LGLKVDYIKVARIVGQHEAYNALFGPDIPRAKDKACRWCGAYHLPDVNCGPTMETKLKSKDEIDQLVQNVSVMIKIFEKAKRSNEDKKAGGIHPAGEGNLHSSSGSICKNARWQDQGVF
jgi:hypothetical protein